MFFECRWGCPSVSPTFQPALELFAKGKARAALAELLAKRPAWASAADAIFCGDLARAAGDFKRFAAIIARARRFFPQDDLLDIEWARIQTVRHRYGEARRLIAGLRQRRADAFSHALEAACIAQMGFEREARAMADRHEPATCADPRVAYELAAAELRLRQWDRAITWAKRSVQLAPGWARARIFLAEALLARGRHEDAESVLWRGLDSGLEDATLELVSGLLAIFLGRPADALPLLLRSQLAWPRRRGERDFDLEEYLIHFDWPRPVVKPWLATVREHAPTLYHHWITPPLPGRRARLSLPAICQEGKLCVPTSFSMVAAAQGLRLDPRELYDEMTGREGTPIWRLVEVARQRGFTVFCLRAELEVLAAAIDQGVAAIGLIEGLFEGHVEVISGYDFGRRLLEMRDPMSWQTGFMPAAALAERYASAGGGVFALVAPGQTFVLPEGAEAGVLTALVELERACALGERELADEAFARIPDDSPASPRRDRVAAGVAIGPRRHAERLHLLASDPNQPLLTRLHALLELDADEFDTAKATFDDTELGSFGRRLLRLSALQREQAADRVVELARRQLDRTPQVEVFWSYLAEALARLGRNSEARQALDRLLELAPDSAQARSMAQRLFPSRRTFAEAHAEIVALIERHPYHHQLRLDLANVLLLGGDGRGFERCAEQAIRYLPRQPAGYALLAQWYLRQNRPDLAKATLARGRALLGPRELPLWPFEEEGAPTAAEPPDLRQADRSTLFFLAAQEVFPGDADQDPPASPAFDQLQALAAAGGLPWWEQARLAAFALHRQLDLEGGPGTPNQLAALLPKQFAGPPGPALAIFLDALDPGRLSRLAAESLLRWAETRIEFEVPPGMRFDLAMLRNCGGDHDAAAAAFADLARTEPGFAGAHFQLGWIRATQGDTTAARVAFETALTAQPSHEGALEQTIRLAAERNDWQAERRALIRQLQVFPYSFDNLESAAFRQSEREGLDSALRGLERLGEAISPALRTLLRFRLMAERGPDAAAAALAELRAKPALAAAEPYGALFTELVLLLDAEDWPAALSCAERGLAQHPDHLFFATVKAQMLGAQDVARARSFAREQAVRGVLGQTLLNILIEGTPPAQRLNEAMALCKESRRGRTLARALAQVLPPYLEPPEAEGFLRFCRDSFPQLPFFHEALARHLIGVRPAEALQIAEGLLRDDPESAQNLELMAIVRGDQDPAGAIALLERAFGKTGDLDTLCRLANCQRRMRDAQAAEATFRRVLKRAPGSPLVVLELVDMAVPLTELFDDLAAAVAMGKNGDFPNLHFLALEAAWKKGKALPAGWLEGAIVRIDTLLAEYPEHSQLPAEAFGRLNKERLTLGRFAALWLDQQGRQAEAKTLRQRYASAAARIFSWRPFVSRCYIPPARPAIG